MKTTILTCLAWLLVLPVFFAQTSDSWERTADRLAEKAERLAEKVERTAERHADRWEAAANRISRQVERRWNDDWSAEVERLPHEVERLLCPEGAYLGVESSTISKEKARRLGFDNAYGSYVSRVVENSAAARAGLQPFDYLYGVNDQRTSNNQNLSDILEDFEAGEKITLHFVRKGEKMSAEVTLSDYDDNDWDVEDDRQGYLGVSPANEDQEADADGVPVNVVEKSAAETMGLREGDIITGVNGYRIIDWDDITTAIGTLSPGENIEVSYRREGKDLTAKGTLQSQPDWDDEEWKVDVNWEEDGQSWGGEEVQEASESWEQDEQNDNRGFMGIHPEKVSEEKARKLGFDHAYGTYVVGIVPNSGADKAGLRPLDYIYGIDEYRVGENQHLGGILNKFSPGQKATVHFVRKGKKQSASLTFGKVSEAEKVERNSCQDPFFGILQDHSQDPENVDGVLVKPVKGSTAEQIGLQDGDQITGINGYRMVDWTDIAAAVEMLTPGENISVEYRRNGKTAKASGAIRSLADTKKCPNCDCGEEFDVFISGGPADLKIKRFEKGPAEVPPMTRLDAGASKVSVENVSSDEVEVLRSKGVDFSQSSTLSVENLRMSPNPNTGTFSLDFNLPASGNTTVRIFNMSGRVIYEYELGSFSGKFSDTVDISQNGPGNYFLQVRQDGKIFTKKILLAKG